MNIHSLRPEAGESLGKYLKRLRAAASKVQDRFVRLEDVAAMSKGLPPEQQFTVPWLSVAESDGYKQPGVVKLIALSKIYSELLKTAVRPEWLVSFVEGATVFPELPEAVFSDPQPLPGESLGEYLRRLRELASVAQGKILSCEGLAELVAHLPARQSFSGNWLRMVESDTIDRPGPDKLTTLADLYSRLLNISVQPERLLSLAGYTVGGPVESLEADEIDKLLQHDNILALVAIAGALIELGHPEDVDLLVTFAGRYLTARDPGRKTGDIFADPIVSRRVNDFMKKMRL